MEIQQHCDNAWLARKLQRGCIDLLVKEEFRTIVAKLTDALEDEHWDDDLLIRFTIKTIKLQLEVVRES